jgi:hypothetical protein
MLWEGAGGSGNGLECPDQLTSEDVAVPTFLSHPLRVRRSGAPLFLEMRGRKNHRAAPFHGLQDRPQQRTFDDAGSLSRCSVLPEKV